MKKLLLLFLLIFFIAIVWRKESRSFYYFKMESVLQFGEPTMAFVTSFPVNTEEYLSHHLKAIW